MLLQVLVEVGVQEVAVLDQVDPHPNGGALRAKICELGQETATRSCREASATSHLVDRGTATTMRISMRALFAVYSRRLAHKVAEDGRRKDKQRRPLFDAPNTTLRMPNRLTSNSR